MAVPGDGRLPLDGAHPALIEWRGPHPAPALEAQGLRLVKLTVRHPDVAELAKLNVQDPRIVFELGPLAIEAVIQTPHGPRTLA